MKFSIDQKALSIALSQCVRVVSPKPTHPVLGCIKLDVNDGVTLTAFDLSTAITIDVEATVESGGSVCLSGRLLADIVSRLPSGNVVFESIEESENGIKIQSLSGEFTIQGMDASEFPELPQCKNKPFLIETDTLVNGLRSVLYAASTDATKQILIGVNIATSTDAIKFAATDGHRLVVVENEIPQKTKINSTILATALSDLVSLLGGTEIPSIEMAIDGEQVVFKAGDRSLITRVLDGAYPNYPQLLPPKFEGFAVVNRKQLLSSLDRISVLDQKDNVAKLSFSQSDQQVTIHRQTEMGNAHESMPVDLTGDDIQIGFNSKYLIEALKNLDSTDVRLNFNQPNTPVVLNPVGGDKVTALIMPIQIIK